MRHVIVSLVSVVLIVVLAIGGFFLTSTPASAELPPQCSISALGNSLNLTLTCIDPETGATLGPGDIDLSVLGNQVVVTVPGATVTETVTIPGPTKTETVRPAPVRVTKTVRPAPVRVTQTVRPEPQIVVRTETAVPKPVRITETATETVTPEPVTVTKTVAPEPRQEADERGKMDQERDFFSKDVDLGDDNFTAGEAGLGVLSIFALALVGLLAMYGGYRMGRESREGEDTDFMRALLESAKLNR